MERPYKKTAIQGRRPDLIAVCWIMHKLSHIKINIINAIRIAVSHVRFLAVRAEYES